MQPSKANGVVTGYSANPRIPKAKELKYTNHVGMLADIGFKKQLWALNPELDVVWDAVRGKWEIWKFPNQANVKKKRMVHNCVHVMTVQTKGRSFRELGADVLLKLQAGDTTKYSLKELVAYFDQMDDNIQRAKAKDFKNHIEAIALDTFDYVRDVLKVQVPRAFKGEKFHLIEKTNTQKMASAIGG